MKLSVNINKIATLRNTRSGNFPDPLKAAEFLLNKGAYGITVHPRPDERHIRYEDVRMLKKLFKNYPHKELNIEGNPFHPPFVDLILEILPQQVTLVPDLEHQLTSDHGWNLLEYKERLLPLLSLFQEKGIRTSLFLDPNLEMLSLAYQMKVDRIELYTESYARMYLLGQKEEGIAPFLLVAQEAQKLGLELNAGHDLSLENIEYFASQLPWIKEVSIGHAFIAEALYLGFEKTLDSYLKILDSCY